MFRIKNLLLYLHIRFSGRRLLEKIFNGKRN